MTVEPVRSAAAKGWDGAGAPGGASQGQSPARGAPDPAPRSGALDLVSTALFGSAAALRSGSRATTMTTDLGAYWAQPAAVSREQP
jgi:hypothetical protein